MAADDRLRVLHVIGALSGGGIQKVLLDLLRFRNADRYVVDVCVMADDVGEWGGDAEALGSRIYSCSLRRSPFTFARRFGQIIKDGDYGVIHVQRSSMIMTFPLSVAHSLNVPRRIAHFQNCRQVVAPRDILSPVLRSRLQRRATNVVGASEPVLDSHFGASWRNDPKYSVIPNGIDFDVFLAPQDRAAMRAALGLSQENIVVGHVARFSEAKNHTAIVDVAEAACARDSSLRFVLVGDGPLRPSIEATVAARGLREKIMFTGWRSDIPAVLSAFDMLFFPSRWEGFGLVLVEAQAAGLPCVTSDLPVFEKILHPELWALRFPLSAPREALKGIEFLARSPEERTRLGAAGREHSRRFDIRAVTRRIESLYEGTP
ncbi:glycosyltransferase family 1 protein [soil metagenome]